MLTSITQFCKRYNISRTLAYEEIKTGRLKTRGVGRRCLIGHGTARPGSLFSHPPTLAADGPARRPARARPH